ncbi:kinase-like protein [Wilcoxina mikolae CBS 423.85]|nr:kinase-like protein [Wilcoxina mikolae CBS 423.85]
MRRFLYNVGVPAEAIERYCPGGYHPVYLNDRLKEGRYQILNKLGFGAFSTVWLARDLAEERNVTIKVVVAEKSASNNHQLQILQQLLNCRDDPGYKNVLHLLDSFYVDGPNGRHLCVVLDVLGPLASDVVRRHDNCCLPGNLARKVSRQVLAAVKYVHGAGVAHGDIHLGNILFCVPDLDRMSPAAIVDRFGEPIAGAVTRTDGQPRGEGVPEYLVAPIAYGQQELQNLSVNDVKLIDFGESFFISQPPKKVSTPLSLHPPELVFSHTLSNAVDIWNLGCTIFELTSGQCPFNADLSNHELIPQFEKVLGKIPPHWIEEALARGILTGLPNDEEAEAFILLEEEVKSWENSLSDEEKEMLVRALERMLALKPEERATAKQLMEEAWFNSGE